MNTLNEEINRIKTIMGLITEDTQNKTAVLFDGTSSAGKSKSAELLNAPKFFEATDPNNWVVIDSDHFNDDSKTEGGEGEKRRLKHDHPNIRDWAKETDAGIVSSIYRKDDKDIPQNPYEDQYIEGTDPRLWYMAQEYKTGPWKKVIFDDIGNGITKYLPEIKHKLLIHAPLYVLMKNVGGRNEDENIKNHRDPTGVLDQYLEKYEATTSEPDESIGDPTTEITRNSLKSLLMGVMNENEFPEYTEEYIDDFISKLGIEGDSKYWIKVKNNYLSDDQQLINVDGEQKVYLDKIKQNYF